MNADAETMAEFTRRVHEYVALHKKLEATLPNLPKEATPQQIDEHQRALGKLDPGSTRPAPNPGTCSRPICAGSCGNCWRPCFTDREGGR